MVRARRAIARPKYQFRDRGVRPRGTPRLAPRIQPGRSQGRAPRTRRDAIADASGIERVDDGVDASCDGVGRHVVLGRVECPVGVAVEAVAEVVEVDVEQERSRWEVVRPDPRVRSGAVCPRCVGFRQSHRRPPCIWERSVLGDELCALTPSRCVRVRECRVAQRCRISPLLTSCTKGVKNPATPIAALLTAAVTESGRRGELGRR